MSNTDYYNKITAYYNMDAIDYESRYWKNPVLQQMRQSFREVVKYFPAKSMLEVGCGTGFDLLHFAKTHPHRKIYGLDVSPKMVKVSNDRLAANQAANVEVKTGAADEIGKIFPHQTFDLIYIFFGALNTCEDFNHTAGIVANYVSDNGVIVITYVNKWYIGGILIDIAKLKFKKAFARLKPEWGGYSPVHYLPSHCYTPKQVKQAFATLHPVFHNGYSIVQPGWFYTTINRKLGSRLHRVLWKIDTMLTRTFLWRFGEYGLLVFKRQ